MQRGQLLPPQDRGLLRRIIDALVREAPESVYRFWLSSCLEAYLRGAGQVRTLRAFAFFLYAFCALHTCYRYTCINLYINTMCTHVYTIAALIREPLVRAGLGLGLGLR